MPHKTVSCIISKQEKKSKNTFLKDHLAKVLSSGVAYIAIKGDIQEVTSNIGDWHIGLTDDLPIFIATKWNTTSQSTNQPINQSIKTQSTTATWKVALDNSYWIKLMKLVLITAQLCRGWNTATNRDSQWECLSHFLVVFNKVLAKCPVHGGLIVHAGANYSYTSQL